jgi:uncharacterized membrane protein
MPAFLLLLFPSVAYAASSISDLIGNFKKFIINPIIAILFALAFILFLWGAVAFVWNASDSTSKEDGKNHMIWGLVGMLIMVSAYGIINVAGSLIGVPSR